MKVRDGEGAKLKLFLLESSSKKGVERMEKKAS
jgi:hypothetical protein